MKKTISVIAAILMVLIDGKQVANHLNEITEEDIAQSPF